MIRWPMFRKIQLFVYGLMFVGLGVFALASKAFLPEADLPFWPVDGLAAIIGGTFVSWWSYKVMTESDDNHDERT